MKLRKILPPAAAVVLVSALAAVAQTPATLGTPAQERERVLSPGRNEWEPAIAADAEGHVLIATTRYSASPACDGCPRPFIAFKRSEDGGETWSDRRYLCRCEGSNYQYDPVLAGDNQGRVFALWLDGFRPGVMFRRSDDFGKTWSDPVAVASPEVLWSDKPWIGISDDGEDVYVTFNGYRHGWEWGVVSHDAGGTWEKPVLMPHAMPRFSRYYFAAGVTVLPDGTALASIEAWRQKYHVGNVLLQVMRSDDGGKSWEAIDIGTSAHGRECPKFGSCRWGYLGPQMAIASDDEGNAYVLYNRFDEPNDFGRLLFRSSSDGGKTWSDARELGDSDADHEYPIMAATGDGDVRIAWMDNAEQWNTMYRRSTDAGKTWSDPVVLSNRPGGAGYKSPEGFHFPYGDYGQMAIGTDDASYVTWGEGYSWFGPGGTWWNRVPAGEPVEAPPDTG